MTVKTRNALRSQAGSLFYYFAILVTPVFAHNPDTSYLRLHVTDDAIEIRLSYDIITLLEIVPHLDANGDKSVSRAELAAADPAIRGFLKSRVSLEIDEQSATFDQSLPFIWPEEKPHAITQIEYHEVVLHFPFQIKRAPPDLIYIDFNFFAEFGERHKVLSKLNYRTFNEEILFTLEEPDYELDLVYILSQEASQAKTVDAVTTRSPEKRETRRWSLLVLILLPVWALLSAKARKTGRELTA
ncbi:MAG: hypothetical protein AAGA58_09570 [Verrucomicrobiota bacterium]